MRIFLAVSISCRRRRVFDSEETQSLSQLFWFSRHSREEPCSERASESKSHTQSAAGCISCADTPCANLHTPGLLFPTLSPRMEDGWSVVRDGPSWRQSASRSVPKPWGEAAALNRQMITLRMRTGIPSAPGQNMWLPITRFYSHYIPVCYN